MLHGVFFYWYSVWCVLLLVQGVMCFVVGTGCGVVLLLVQGVMYFVVGTGYVWCVVGTGCDGHQNVGWCGSCHNDWWGSCSITC